MNKKIKWLMIDAIIFAVLLAIDQVTKYLAITYLKDTVKRTVKVRR